MSTELRPDLCILGGGPGGVSLALGAAAQGQSVVLVEKDTLGGRRLRDTIPRHVLLAAGRAAGALRKAAHFGIAAEEPKADFASLHQHAAAVLAAMAPNYTQARLEAANVKVIRGPGRFTGPDACEAGGVTIKARHFVVATGSTERRLSIPGLDLVRPLDCAALCALERMPGPVIVIGEDADGLAVAQALCRLGCQVSVLTSGDILSLEDEEFAAPVRSALVRDGLVIHERIRILRIEPRGQSVRVFVATGGHEKPVLGSHILVAAGRMPAVKGLGLGVAGVRYSESGIKTNGSFATSNRRIYALGGAVGGTRPDGAAERDAFVVLQALLGLRGAKNRRPAEPRLVLTSPAIAMAGLSEAQARAAHGEIRILRWPFAETGRARIEHISGGHVKLITSEDGAIVGAGAVGDGAEELINLFVLAISKGVTASDIASILVPYPALSGAAQNAAMIFQESRLEAPLRRVLLAANEKINQAMLQSKELWQTVVNRASHMFRGPK